MDPLLNFLGFRKSASKVVLSGNAKLWNLGRSKHNATGLKSGLISYPVVGIYSDPLLI